MKLLSWNIRHGGIANGSLAPALMAHEPDVIVLCEYRVEGSAKLVEQLRFFGWPHSAASRVGGKANGVAVVSREPSPPCGELWDVRRSMSGRWRRLCLHST
jgi:exonuclease III